MRISEKKGLPFRVLMQKKSSISAVGVFPRACNSTYVTRGSGRLHHIIGHLPGLVELGPVAPASCRIIMTNAFSQSSITQELQSIGG